MASQIDEITINYEEEGVLKVKEIDKVILTRGGWTTILFKFVEWDPKKEVYGATKYSIRRYQKRNNNFIQQSRFNISSEDQARKIIEALQAWLTTDGAGALDAPVKVKASRTVKKEAALGDVPEDSL